MVFHIDLLYAIMLYFLNSPTTTLLFYRAPQKGKDSTSPSPYNNHCTFKIFGSSPIEDLYDKGDSSPKKEGT